MVSSVASSLASASSSYINRNLQQEDCSLASSIGSRRSSSCGNHQCRARGLSQQQSSRIADHDKDSNNNDIQANEEGKRMSSAELGADNDDDDDNLGAYQKQPMVFGQKQTCEVHQQKSYHQQYSHRRTPVSSGTSGKFCSVGTGGSKQCQCELRRLQSETASLCCSCCSCKVFAPSRQARLCSKLATLASQEQQICCKEQLTRLAESRNKDDPIKIVIVGGERDVSCPPVVGSNRKLEKRAAYEQLELAPTCALLARSCQMQQVPPGSRKQLTSANCVERFACGNHASHSHDHDDARCRLHSQDRPVVSLQQQHQSAQGNVYKAPANSLDRASSTHKNSTVTANCYTTCPAKLANMSPRSPSSPPLDERDSLAGERPKLLVGNTKELEDDDDKRSISSSCSQQTRTYLLNSRALVSDKLEGDATSCTDYNVARSDRMLSRSNSRCSSISNCSAITTASTFTSVSSTCSNGANSAMSSVGSARAIILSKTKLIVESDEGIAVDENNNHSSPEGQFGEPPSAPGNNVAPLPPSPPPPPPPPPPPAAAMTGIQLGEITRAISKTDDLRDQAPHLVGIKRAPLQASGLHPLPAFIPPQFSTPPKDGANIKPSEYLKRVASNSALFVASPQPELAKASPVHPGTPTPTEVGSLSSGSSRAGSTTGSGSGSSRIFERSQNYQISANRFKQAAYRRPLTDLNRSQSTSALNTLGITSCELDVSTRSDIDTKQQQTNLIDENNNNMSDLNANLMDAIRNFDKMKDLKRCIDQNSDQTKLPTKVINLGASKFQFPQDNLLAATKRDLIAELKESKDLDGIKRMRESSRSKSELNQIMTVVIQELQPEDYLDQVTQNEPEAPLWRRQMLAKKAADKARREQEEKVRIELEEQRLKQVPAWKLQMLAKKAAERNKRGDLDRIKRESGEKRFNDMPVWRRQLMRNKMTASTGNVNNIEQDS